MNARKVFETKHVWGLPWYEWGLRHLTPVDLRFPNRAPIVSAFLTGWQKTVGKAKKAADTNSVGVRLTEELTLQLMKWNSMIHVPWVLLKRFHLNGNNIGFHLETQKLEWATLKVSIIPSESEKVYLLITSNTTVHISFWPKEMSIS